MQTVKMTFSKQTDSKEDWYLDSSFTADEKFSNKLSAFLKIWHPHIERNRATTKAFEAFHFAESVNRHFYSIQFCSGSTLEGTLTYNHACDKAVNYQNSDHDLMIVYTVVHVNSMDRQNASKSFKDYIIYETNFSQYTGYTKLKLKSMADCLHCYMIFGKKSINTLKCNCDPFLSSRKVKEDFFYARLSKSYNQPLTELMKNHTLKGPSLCADQDILYDNYASDFVPCLYVPHWPSQFKPWEKRPSPSDWPSKKLKRSICEKGCFLVPVGNPHSPECDLEWRFSFSVAEKQLIKTMNVTQLNCHLLLKALLKTYLRTHSHVGEVLHSYHMKTLLFWFIEEASDIIWKPYNLIICMKKLFKKLKKYIKRDKIPHYFNSENDLLQNRMRKGDKPILIKIIDSIIKNIVNKIKDLPVLNQNFVETNLLWEKTSELQVNMSMSYEHILNLWYLQCCSERIVALGYNALSLMEVLVPHRLLEYNLRHCLYIDGEPCSHQFIQDCLIRQFLGSFHKSRNEKCSQLFETLFSEKLYRPLPKIIRAKAEGWTGCLYLAVYCRRKRDNQHTGDLLTKAEHYLNKATTVVGLCIKNIRLCLFYIQCSKIARALKFLYRAINLYEPYLEKEDHVRMAEKSIEECMEMLMKKWYTGRYMFRVAFHWFEYNYLPQILQYEMLHENIKQQRLSFINGSYSPRVCKDNINWYFSWPPHCIFIFLEFCCYLESYIYDRMCINFHELTKLIEHMMNVEDELSLEIASVCNLHAWCGLKLQLYTIDVHNSLRICTKATNLYSPDEMAKNYRKNNDKLQKSNFAHHFLQYVLKTILQCKQ